MLQRLRDVLHLTRSEQPAIRQHRPNELRLDVVRAERLRRDERFSVNAASRPVLSVEEQQARRVPAPPVTASTVRLTPKPVSLLKTRSGLRQAWLAKEILAPPLALWGCQTGDSEL